jgi:hypothetical protein
MLWKHLEQLCLFVSSTGYKKIRTYLPITKLSLALFGDKICLSTVNLLLHQPTLLPPGLEVETMTAGEYKFSMPGMSNSLRITTKPDYFEQHPESVELWSPGSPLFPVIQEELEEAISCDLKSLLSYDIAKKLH